MVPFPAWYLHDSSFFEINCKLEVAIVCLFYCRRTYQHDIDKLWGVTGGLTCAFWMRRQWFRLSNWEEMLTSLYFGAILENSRGFGGICFRHMFLKKTSCGVELPQIVLYLLTVSSGGRWHLLHATEKCFLSLCSQLSIGSRRLAGGSSAELHALCSPRSFGGLTIRTERERCDTTEFGQLFTIILLWQLFRAWFHTDTLAIRKGTVVHFLQALSTSLSMTMTKTETLVVIDELVVLTRMVWSVLEFSRQKTTVKIVVAKRVDQEAHSGKQVEMLYRMGWTEFFTGFECTTLGLWNWRICGIMR